MPQVTQSLRDWRRTRGTPRRVSGLTLHPSRRGSIARRGGNMPTDDTEKLIRWGTVHRAYDRPSVWDLSACLLSSVDSAEDFAHPLPESAASVTRFTQEIRRIIKELMSSFYERLAPPSPYANIMNGLSS